MKPFLLAAAPTAAHATAAHAQVSQELLDQMDALHMCASRADIRYLVDYKSTAEVCELAVKSAQLSQESRSSITAPTSPRNRNSIIVAYSQRLVPSEPKKPPFRLF
jgi:hypothetical protein